MPAVDPFSASFRPFVSRDKAERRDVLQPIDRNTVTGTTPLGSSSSNPLPKPRKYRDELPQKYYEPPYRHGRSGSTASLDFESLALETRHNAEEIGSDDWMNVEVTRCLETSKGALDVKGKGLTSLSTRIADLNHVVTLNSSTKSPLPPSPYSTRSPIRRQSPSYTHSPNETLSPGAGPYSANSRPFMRVVSAPVSAHAFNEMRQQRSTMERQPSGLRTGRTLLDSPTLTETSEDGSESTPPTARGLLASPSLDAPLPGRAFGNRSGLGRSKTGIGMRTVSENVVEKEFTINAAQNFLTSLPSALFEIQSLTSLTLRSNRLTRLPAAIGELYNLKELNIGGNKISELPSTIEVLTKLEIFNVHPNPWTPQPTTETINGRLLGPLTTHTDNNVIPLHEICANILMTPRLPSNLPPMIDPGYDWQPRAGKAHPLLDPRELQFIFENLGENDCAKMLQASRSACNAVSRKVIHPQNSHGRRGSTASNMGSSNSDSLFPSTGRPPRPDDASENPYYDPCPNPLHRESSTSEPPVMTRRLYLRAAEERLEWTTICKQKDLPIRWKGCSPGCLDFLEQGHVNEIEDDMWGLSDEDE